MPASYNGFRVGTQSELGIKKFTVPDSHVVLPILPATAPALLWVAEQVDKRVKDIDVAKGHRTPDDWGYAYRDTRGASTWSNHASGTAIDLNATQWPRGMARMTPHEVLQCRLILNQINIAAGRKIVAWGGDYKVSPLDQMHWEITKGTTPGDVHRALVVLNKPAKTKRPPTLRMLGPRHPYWTAIAQRHLGMSKVDGIYGKATRAKVRAFRRAHHIRPYHHGVIGARVWALLLKEK